MIENKNTKGRYNMKTTVLIINNRSPYGETTINKLYEIQKDNTLKAIDKLH